MVTLRYAPFPRSLIDGTILFIEETNYEEFERSIKGPCKGATLSIGALMGNLDMFCLLQLLEEKKIHIWAQFSWTQKTLNIKSGAICNFSKEQIFTEFV